MRKFRVVLAVAVVMSLASAGAHAGTIIGGSALLDAAKLTQLETWLGEGPLVVTNIFTGVSGDGKTAPTFHAAANGQGRTFVLYQATSPVSAIIGGYNPQSWSSSGSYNMTPNIVDRKAFLFNLTSGALQRQRVDSPTYGQYQTYNNNNYGPTFGGGMTFIVPVHSIMVGMLILMIIVF